MGIKIKTIMITCFDKFLTIVHLLRRSKIADTITYARIDEADKVKKEYDKKFKKQQKEFDIELKNIQDEYTSSLESRRNFYERELELSDKQRTVDLDKKQKEIEECKNEIKKMTQTYEEANHKLRSMTLLMADIKSYLDLTEKRGLDGIQGYKTLEQRLSFIDLGLAESKFLENNK